MLPRWIKVVAGFDLPAGDDAPEVGEPGEEPFHLPNPLVASQETSILGLEPASAVWGDYRDPRSREIRI